MKYFVSTLCVLVIAMIIWMLYSYEFIANMADEEATQHRTNRVLEGVATAFSTGIVRDASGRPYRTVTIGEQTWMAEDLHYAPAECADGQPLEFVDGLERGPGVKLYVTNPRYAYYNGDSTTGWGLIYNHAAVMQCELCPEGFRVPSKKDWDVLIETLGGSIIAGKRMLPGGDTGFEAVPAGRIDDYGSVLGNEFVFWWTSDYAPTKREVEAYSAELRINGEYKMKGQDARMGAYLRCVK
ncbi:FISUMP domain-containing protein [Lewinella sp. W8]|uniref:FISUMP domain-containing protein n=1 Tax=Lewinella sp. W8 TaxID=2528208 RepID=UPI0010675A60|nr:FISUMP domain-containing protein [Lewinella sp. W8]MTB53316.1 hypothetical protein [Lewinella sp. W8]